MLIHSYVNSSYVNGPGNRFVLWTQGCSKGCKNCYNPETWNKNGFEYKIEHLIDLIKISDVDGLTISGGDPLEQPDELLKFLKEVHKLNLKKGIILFTGYTIFEIHNMGGNILKCLEYIDVLIDGRYEEDKRTYQGLYGSSNQNVYHLSSKIWIDELNIDQEIEINFYNNNVILTGFPVSFGKELNRLGLNLNGNRRVVETG